jgi:hypothetical protein
VSALRVSAELALPLEVAGEAIAILAKRGAGKTNTASVLVEELDAAGVQVVVVDPVGAWWGLRSSSDGKGPGLSIPILGGQHADIPLEQNAGGLIADVVVDTGSPLLLDLSDFPSKASTEKFTFDFADRLYRRKARSSSLLHLVLEEADVFARSRRRAASAATPARWRTRSSRSSAAAAAAGTSSASVCGGGTRSTRPRPRRWASAARSRSRPRLPDLPVCPGCDEELDPSASRQRKYHDEACRSRARRRGS